MQSKIVYQLDEQGYFVNKTHADESPLEPGVFLIPARCTELEPPVPIEGKLLRLVDHMWVYEDMQEQATEENFGLEPDPNLRILAQIREIESAKQPRAMRDFALNGDRTRLEAIDKDIAALRAELVKNETQA